MLKKIIILTIFSVASICFASPTTPQPSQALTDSINKLNNPSSTTVTAEPKPATMQAPVIIPPPPNLSAKAYVLIDVGSGNVIAQKNMDKRLAPASLTKLMSLYLVESALQSGQIHLNDKVSISKDAWQTGGSRMFLRAGESVELQKLIQGVIVASGNDAVTALAQYVAGTIPTFVQMMNQTATALSMTNTHFSDPTGLPAADHYSSPHDLAKLARAVILNFPEYYHFYNEKWITYDKIRQPNRNRLLWRDPSADGLKTGHTEEAGYCLIASAKRDGIRLISVVMGAPTDEARASNSEALLNYGFRFFETHKLYSANQAIKNPRVYFGEDKTVPMGVAQDLYVTIPKGSFKQLKASLTLNSNRFEAPINKGQTYGEINITLHGKPIKTTPIIALETDPRGGLWAKFRDHIASFF